MSEEAHWTFASVRVRRYCIAELWMLTRTDWDKSVYCVLILPTEYVCVCVCVILLGVMHCYNYSIIFENVKHFQPSNVVCVL